MLWSLTIDMPCSFEMMCYLVVVSVVRKIVSHGARSRRLAPYMRTQSSGVIEEAFSRRGTSKAKPRLLQFQILQADVRTIGLKPDAVNLINIERVLGDGVQGIPLSLFRVGVNSVQLTVGHEDVEGSVSHVISPW